MNDLDTGFIRRQFPAFEEPSLDGWAFFENAGGSYACKPVIDRLTRYYRETKVQPYAAYPASAAAGTAMDEAYTRLAACLNVGEDELHIGPSTTQNAYVLAKAFREVWTEGGEIIVTNQDHEANSGPWRRLAETGITVREWPVDPDTGLLDPAGLDALLNQRTRLVAFPHCSNIVAAVNPVAEIAAKVRAAGAVSCVDGVSAAPHGFPDVAALGADIYLFSAYKTYGPHQGIMTVRREVLDQLPNQSHYFNSENLRKKLVPAGPDHAQISACAGMVDYVDAVYAHHSGSPAADTAQKARAVRMLFQTHEKRLLQPLLDFLKDRNDLRLIGPADAALKEPTVAILPYRRSAEDIAEAIINHKIMAGAGRFYANRLIEALNVPEGAGVLRVSFVHYTQATEVDRLIAALEDAL